MAPGGNMPCVMYNDAWLTLGEIHVSGTRESVAGKVNDEIHCQVTTRRWVAMLLLAYYGMSHDIVRCCTRSTCYSTYEYVVLPSQGSTRSKSTLQYSTLMYCRYTYYGTEYGWFASMRLPPAPERAHRAAWIDDEHPRFCRGRLFCSVLRSAVLLRTEQQIARLRLPPVLARRAASACSPHSHVEILTSDL